MEMEGKTGYFIKSSVVIEWLRQIIERLRTNALITYRKMMVIKHFALRFYLIALDSLLHSYQHVSNLIVYWAHCCCRNRIWVKERAFVSFKNSREKKIFLSFRPSFSEIRFQLLLQVRPCFSCKIKAIVCCHYRAIKKNVAWNWKEVLSPLRDGNAKSW